MSKRSLSANFFPTVISWCGDDDDDDDGDGGDGDNDGDDDDDDDDDDDAGVQKQQGVPPH